MTTTENHNFSRRIYRPPGHGLLATILTLIVLLTSGAVRADMQFDLDDYKGNVVLIDFWASWCGPCRQSFPWMNDMHAKYRDEGLVIIAVNLDNDMDAANRFLSDYPTQFDVHFDRDKILARDFEVAAMPSSFLIGRNGQIVSRHLGFKVRRQNEYEAAIRAALEMEK